MTLRLAVLLVTGLLLGDAPPPVGPENASVRVEFTGRWVGQTGTEKEPIDVTLSDGTMELRTRTEQVSFPCTLTADDEGRVFLRGPFDLSKEGTYRVEQAGVVRLSFRLHAQRSTAPSRFDDLATVWVLRPVKPKH
jgi:hypothetical protein